MNSRTVLTVGVVLLVGALSLGALAQSSAPDSQPKGQGSVQSAPPDSADVHFPAVSGSNLERRKFNLPADFEGTLNLVALAFLRDHQGLVDTWTPTAKRLTEADPKLRFYEVPVLSESNKLFSLFIDGGMRAGIPSKATREATITLYTDQAKFLKTAGLLGPKTIYLLLTDRAGRIFWRGEGAYTPAKAAELEEAIREAR